MKKTACGAFFLLLLLAAGQERVLAAPSERDFSADASVALEKSTRAEREDQSPSSYIIGPSNLLQIKIFGESNINQLYRVEEDGFIKHALIGRVRVADMTVADAEKMLEQKLDGDYIINPQVNIFILEYSHFSIIGEVRKPGNYELSGRVTVIRAISLAGGFTPIANQRGVQIIRKNSDGTETKMNVDATRIMNGDLSGEVDLQADDVVVIPKSFF